MINGYYLAPSKAPFRQKYRQDHPTPVDRANIGGFIRGGKGVNVSGNTMLEPGDHVIIFCLEHVLKKLEKYFNK